MCRANRNETSSRTEKTGTSRDMNDNQLMVETERNTDATHELECEHYLVVDTTRERNVHRQDAPRRLKKTSNLSACQNTQGAMERECYWPATKALQQKPVSLLSAPQMQLK